MAHVLALDSFACARYPNHSLPPMPNAAPKLATHGGPVYYRQHEVIQLVEVSAPPPAPHPSTITTSSVPSSSAYTESCSEESDDDDEDEDESVVSSYCSSDEGDGDVEGAPDASGEEDLPPAPVLHSPLD